MIKGEITLLETDHDTNKIRIDIAARTAMDHQANCENLSRLFEYMTDKDKVGVVIKKMQTGGR